MDTWGPGVEHWSAGDGFYAVMVDPGASGALPTFVTAQLREVEAFSDIVDARGNFDVRVHTVLARPTTVVRCDEQGVAVDADLATPAVELLTEFEFPAGTSARDAMIAAGFDVE